MHELYGNHDASIICVCGSRGIGQKDTVSRILNGIVDKFALYLSPPGYVLTGGAKGIDSYARDWAEKLDYDWHVMHPDWDHYGKSAGYRRNEDMLEQIRLDSEAHGIPHYLIAMYDGESPGTKHMIDNYESHFKMKSLIFVSPQTHKDNPTHEYSSRWDTSFNI